MDAFEYLRSELLVIDVHCRESALTERGRELLDEGELANEICRGGQPGRCAPDYSGPVGSGDRRTDFNVLIEASALGDWRDVAAQYGCSVEPRGAPADGHFGDGHWAGIDIVARPGDDARVYWIER